VSETLRSIRRAFKDPLQSLAARVAVTGLGRAPLSLADLDELEPRAIVASRTDRIGDLLVSTPVLAALHQRWPRARIVVIPGPRNRAVLSGLPFVEEGPAFGREPGSWARVRAWLKRERFDVSVSLRSESMAGVYVSAWSGAPVRMTLNANKTSPAHNLILGVSDEHLLTRYAKAARLLGYEMPAMRPLYVVPSAAESEGASAAADLAATGKGPLVGIQVMSRASRRHAKRALAFETLVAVTRPSCCVHSGRSARRPRGSWRGCGRRNWSRRWASRRSRRSSGGSRCCSAATRGRCTSPTRSAARPWPTASRGTTGRSG
jgi:hypothetical protein